MQHKQNAHRSLYYITTTEAALSVTRSLFFFFKCKTLFSYADKGHILNMFLSDNAHLPEVKIWQDLKLNYKIILNTENGR